MHNIAVKMWYIAVKMNNQSMLVFKSNSLSSSVNIFYYYITSTLASIDMSTVSASMCTK